MSSIRDSKAFNLSRSIFTEVCESVSWSFSISPLLCLLRVGEGLEVELELDDRSESFKMRTDGRLRMFQVTRCSGVTWC